MRSTRTRLAVGGLVAILLLALFFRGVEWQGLATALRQAHRAPLVAVLGTTVVLYLVRAWRWGYLLSPLARVGYGRLVSATFIGFTTGLVIPRAGEVVRPYLVGRSHGLRLSAGFATIILERLFDLITVLILFGLYLFVLPMPEAQTRGRFLVGLKTAGAMAGAGALGLLFLLAAFHAHADRVMSFFDRLLTRLPVRVSAPISRELRAFGEGLAVLQAPVPHLLMISGQSLVIWLTIAVGLYLNNRAFDLTLPFHSTFLLLGFLTVGVAVPTPGMVGGFHESYLLALTEAFGVDRGIAAAAGIASHALTNLPVLLVGLPLLSGEGLSVAKVARMTEEDR